MDDVATQNNRVHRLNYVEVKITCVYALCSNILFVRMLWLAMQAPHKH
jgi:hypothetical protein